MIIDPNADLPSSLEAIGSTLTNAARLNAAVELRRFGAHERRRTRVAGQSAVQG